MSSWWRPSRAEAIPVSAGKLDDWAPGVGTLPEDARTTPVNPLRSADSPELKRLRQLAALFRRGVVEAPAELFTPKRPADG